MAFKETMKDIARAPFQWNEVKFKKEAAEFAKTHGVSAEQAEKAIFDARLKAVDREVVLNSAIDYDSKEFSNLLAAMYELFGSKEMDQFKEHADNPSIFRTIGAVPTSGELRASQKYFRDKFSGEAPANAIVTDAAEKTKLILALAARFSRDTRVTGAADLRAVLASNPDLAADLGKILQAKEELERHERMFGREMSFDKSLEQLKQTGKDSLKTMLWNAPMAYAKKFNIPRNLNQFSSHLKAMMKLIGQETKAVADIAIDASVVAGQALRNNRAFEALTNKAKQLAKRMIKP